MGCARAGEKAFFGGWGRKGLEGRADVNDVKVQQVPSQGVGPTQVSPVRKAAGGRWGDLPLRNKTNLLLMMAAVGGAAVGATEVRLGEDLWPLMLGLAALVIGLVLVAHAWIWHPVDKLVRQIELTATTGRPEALRHLPVRRMDETGRLAKAVQTIAISAFRNGHEAKRLRRTLDSRIAQATAKATRQLRQLAMRDSLTNLGNRRFLDEHLEPVIHSAVASQTDLICLMIDVDNFKQINDQLGHAAGDEVLGLLATLLQACSRREDLAVRYGGDEFVLLLPGATLERAAQIADMIRRLFRQQSKAITGGGPQPDLSIGVSSLARDGRQTGAELVTLADQHLYEAKRAGKGLIAGLAAGGHENDLHSPTCVA